MNIIILALDEWKFVLKKLNIFGNVSIDFSDGKNWQYFLILSWVFSMHRTSPIDLRSFNYKTS